MTLGRHLTLEQIERLTQTFGEFCPIVAGFHRQVSQGLDRRSYQ